MSANLHYELHLLGAKPCVANGVTYTKKRNCLEQMLFLTFKKMSEVQGSADAMQLPEEKVALNQGFSEPQYSLVFKHPIKIQI